MIVKLIENAVKKYAHNPIPFIYIALMRLFSVMITGLSAFAIILLLILTLTTFGMMKQYGLYATIGVSIVAFIFFAYFWAGYKGSMIKAFINAEIGTVHLHDYLSYALKNASRYFKIFLIKNLFLIILNLPLAAIFFALKTEIISFVGIVMVALHLLVSFFVKFIFSFVYVAAAVKEIAALDGVKNGVRFVLKNAPHAFVIYLLYTLIWTTFFIPGLNLFTLTAFYPVIYMVLINFYKAKSID